MKNTVQVIEIKEPPQLKNPIILQGIRDKEAARIWGEKHGHAIVYFMTKKQRVYAERLQTQINQQARKIEQASQRLVEKAEASL